MNKILITGANGFIGKHIVNQMSSSPVDVHAVGRRNKSSVSANIKYHQLDLFDAKQVKHVLQAIKPTHLLHLSWCTTPGQYWKSLENFEWVLASLELAKHFYENGGQRMVTAGTCAEYDWRFGYLSEDTTPLSFSTPYAAAKNSLQSLLKSYSKEVGKSYAWGRIFFLYGPYEHPTRLVASVITMLLAGKRMDCSHGMQIRDFLHVEDAADAFIQLLNSDVEGPVNIASGNPIRLKDMILQIASELNGTDLISLGGLPAREDDPPLILAHVDRLNQELGWTPKIDIKSGLESTIQWWKSYQGGANDDYK